MADASGPYQFNATQTTVTLDGSGSNDPERAIANYEWQVGGSTVYTGPLSTYPLTLVEAIAYSAFDAQINALSADVLGCHVLFDFEVLDHDLLVNALAPGWQTLSLEIDDEPALGEADVLAAGTYWFATYTGAMSLVDPSVVSGGATLALPLKLFPAGTNTVYLNIAGSHDSMAVSFYNNYPEPTPLALLCLGGIGLLRRRRRRNA